MYNVQKNVLRVLHLIVSIFNQLDVQNVLIMLFICNGLIDWFVPKVTVNQSVYVICLLDWFILRGRKIGALILQPYHNTTWLFPLNEMTWTVRLNFIHTNGLDFISIKLRCDEDRKLPSYLCCWIALKTEWTLWKYFQFDVIKSFIIYRNLMSK